MRIHLLSTLLCRAGGADVYNECLAIGLAERGHTVSLLCQQAADSLVQRFPTALVSLPDYDKWSVLWRAGPYFRWRFWRRSIASVQLQQPDVLICCKGSCSSALVRRFPGAQLIYLPHSRIEPVEIDQMLPPSASWIQRKLACSISSTGELWSLRNAATTVRFTQENVADLRRHYDLSDDVRFDVIPAGIIGPTAIAERRVVPPVRLVSVGRLVESKNLRFLLQTLASLKHLPWQLDIVGEGPERASLERLVDAADLRKQVRFHGQHQDVGQFYRTADLHVFPSKLESLGLVVLEAMAHGVPTLAIHADGQRYRTASHEIITSGVDGLLASSEEDFARTLGECIARPQRLEELQFTARRTYLERHQWSVVLDRWECLLREIVPGAQEHIRDQRSSGRAPSPATPVLAHS